jgi:hypothetical protein
MLWPSSALPGLTLAFAMKTETYPDQGHDRVTKSEMNKKLHSSSVNSHVKDFVMVSEDRVKITSNGVISSVAVSSSEGSPSHENKFYQFDLSYDKKEDDRNDEPQDEDSATSAANQQSYSSSSSDEKKISVLREELWPDSRTSGKNEESGNLMVGEGPERNISSSVEIQAYAHELSNLINLLVFHVNEVLLVDDIPEDIMKTIQSVSMDMKKAKDIMEQEMVKYPWSSHTPSLTQSSSRSMPSEGQTSVDSNHGTISGNTRDRSLLQDEETPRGPRGRNKDYSYYYYSKAEYIQRATKTSRNGVFPQSPSFNQFSSSIEEMMQRGTDNQGPSQFQHHRGLGEAGSTSDKQCNAKIDLDAHKEDQCKRLAECAENFNLYDLFIYYFQDDIDFNTGEFEEEHDISFDEIHVRERLEQIKILTKDIREEWRDSYLDVGGKCDTLLQKFHRFNDEIGVIGKWQGGSVTSVCRAWGTSKYVKLEQIWTFIYKKVDADFATEVVVDIFEELVGCAVSYSLRIHLWV